VRITIDRSGGFANIPLHREIDTATLPDATEIERLAIAARKERPSSTPMADGYTYEITIDGERHVLSEGEGAWGKLIARLESTRG
jgi:hypothetical protein